MRLRGRWGIRLLCGALASSGLESCTDSLAAPEHATTGRKGSISISEKAHDVFNDRKIPFPEAAALLRTTALRISDVRRKTAALNAAAMFDSVARAPRPTAREGRRGSAFALRARRPWP